MKRNVDRFPEDFCFQLTKEEYKNLIFQSGISSLQESENKHGGRRKLPYAFTEQGISMLSAVLRSEIAVKVSVKIMRTFVEMRRFMANNSLVLSRINELEVGLPWCLNIHGHDHSNIELYKDGCKHINLAANVCGYTPINLGKIIKEGVLADVPSIHRMTIDRQVERGK